MLEQPATHHAPRHTINIRFILLHCSNAKPSRSRRRLRVDKAWEQRMSQREGKQKARRLAAPAIG
jgi:hypothetical protein